MEQFFEEMKKDYDNTPIPPQLDSIVRDTVTKATRNSQQANRRKRFIQIPLITVAATFVILVIGINTSTAFAAQLEKIPTMSKLIKVFTVRQYFVSEKNFNADIKAPEIEGLKNEQLQTSLNEKYLQQNKDLYAKFQTLMADLKATGDGKAGVDTGYTIRTDTERIFAIERYVVEVQASAAESLQHDTIDKQKQLLITLPSLFKDDRYVDLISTEIIRQMDEQMKDPNTGAMYFIKGRPDAMDDAFDKIDKEQDFFINADNKLVISFDEYAVAPGVMGPVEFVIPTAVIQDVLVGNDYIK